MKKIFLLPLALMTFLISGYSQGINSPGGVFSAGSSSAPIPLNLQTWSGIYTTRATITNAGNFGINTTTPTERLHVNGNTLSNGSFLTTTGVFGTSGAINMSFLTNGTPRLTIYNSTGNVGIGTTSPTTRLEVAAPGAGTAFRVAGTATPGIIAMEVYNGGVIGTFESSIGSPANSVRLGSRSANNFSLATSNLDRVTILSTNGFMGVGIAAPTEMLHVNGNTKVSGSITSSSNVTIDNVKPVIYTATGTTDLNRYLQIINSSDMTSASGIKAGGILVADDYTYASPSKNDMIVKGKVGIGTKFTGNTNNYLLAVNGRIGAKDIQIEGISDAWTPDYVFEETYNLPTLKEVESYIKTNKHLSEVPSASEMVKDGYSMKEMDKILLQKLEELTLYIIQQQKEIEALKQEIGKSKTKK